MMNGINTMDVSARETGKLGIKQLKRFWNQVLRRRAGDLAGDEWQAEWQLNKTLLSALGLGLEPTMIFMFNYTPSFEELENWIIETAGMPFAENVARYNSLIEGKDLNQEPIAHFLTDEQLQCWADHGYLIIENAISRDDSEETIRVICDFISIKRDDPETWYTHHPARQGIMVQLFQHPVLQKNRQSHKIRMAYEQLWQRKDIWLNTDRVGFNPPETGDWKFPGPNLHWDCKLEPPIPFGTQGILYLADTEANQGAFTLVPGFQHHINDWLRSVPAGKQPYQMDLYALGPKPIVANAGDFILWHHALPHGSSINRSSKPRFVQYINYEPADFS